jgi:eukaryotic-like serine/threonine-protein kinase
MNEQSIFLAALDFADPAERSAYLIKACAGNAALLQKVQALLASHEKSGDFLDMPALRQMSEDPEVTQADGSRTRDEVDLSYLTPSTKPGSLGTLAHYEILQVLGQGGFGTVLKAFDEKLHRLVAIKLLSRELAITSPPRKRFLREARSVAAIKHENVIAIHSVEEQPLPYFVMEFVDGATLQDKMDETGPVPVSEILHIGKQIASGLAAAHALGLIHRDIKPANILMEKGVVQKVKITDFGLARAADDASMTQSGMIAGTPLYMAPEQAKGAKLDARTDLFSLGSVLYALATGHPPFRAPSAFAVLRRVTEDTPRPMQEVISDIPDWLVAIVDKLLAKEPKDRFQSAQELADVLAKCQSELQAGVPVTAVKKLGVLPTAVEPAVKAELKTNKFPVAGVAAGVMLMFLVMTAGLFILNKYKDAHKVAIESPAKTTSSELATGGDADSKSAAGVITPNGPLSATFKNSIGMEFVKVPKGTAWLGGGSGQQRNTKVEIEQDFYLGKYEVTQEEWEAITGLAPSYFSRTGPGADAVKDISDADLKRFPVEQVSWEDCQLFIERLNKKEQDTGRVYRLPKEAEWEYACRGAGDKLDSAFDFYFSRPTNTLLPDQANFEFPTALKRTTKVGSYDANMLGLHDMHGNVWEWCDDEEKVAEGASIRAYRGGSWLYDAAICRAAFRGAGDPASRTGGNGFRLALSPSGVSEPAEQVKAK